MFEGPAREADPSDDRPLWPPRKPWTQKEEGRGRRDFVDDVTGRTIVGIIVIIVIMIIIVVGFVIIVAVIIFFIFIIVTIIFVIVIIVTIISLLILSLS